MIQIFLRLVLSPLGYRAAARALQIVAPLLPGGSFCSANGGQFWVLRLGLYELTRPKEQADDWVWMIDHTIQTGSGKCFLVVGIRASAWNDKRLEVLQEDPDGSFALRHQDLSVFAIERTDSSNAETVHQQLEQLSEKTRITPCCIICDQGADVRAAGQRFAETGDRSTIVVHDIAHAVANAIKRQLNKHPQWEEFLADANRSKIRIRQTPYAFLMPPDLKSKARWMNLDPLIEWSRRIQRFLDDPLTALAKAKAPLDLEKLEEKMGWLRRHAASIDRWTMMMEVAAITLNYIRNQGYHERTHEELQSLLISFDDEPVAAMVAEILSFVKAQADQCSECRLPGCTEVLESLFGKGKQLMGRNKNGYTKTLLTLAASAVKITTANIRSALSAITVEDVHDWIEENLGISLQAQRQRALINTQTGTNLE